MPGSSVAGKHKGTVASVAGGHSFVHLMSDASWSMVEAVLRRTLQAPLHHPEGAAGSRGQGVAVVSTEGQRVRE